MNPVRIIDFVRKNQVEIYAGNYKNDLEGKQLQQLQLFSCNAKEISEEDSFLSLAEKMGIQLPPELFQAYLSKLQQDNTAENFEHFQKNSPISIHIAAEEKTKTPQTSVELFENLNKKEGN